MKGVFWNARGMGKDPKKRYNREMVMDHIGILLGFWSLLNKISLRMSCTICIMVRILILYWNLPRGHFGGILVGVNKDYFDVLHNEHG